MNKILVFVFYFAAAITVFAERKPIDFPLHVQIIEARWNTTPYGTRGWGRGNVKDDNTVRGFDYTFSCAAAFSASNGEDDYYEGRWKKADERLVIILEEIGKRGRTEQCELETSVRNDIYGVRNGQLVVYTQDQYKSMQDTKALAEAGLHPADTDPNHYPLKVAVLSVEWLQSSFGSIGSGKGNIHEGEQSRGFDFSVKCASRFQVGTPGLPNYRGKWIEADKRLLLLMRLIGEERFRTCELKTDLMPGVYLKNNNTGVIGALTQDEFRAWKQRRKTEPQPDAIAGVRTELLSKLTLSSNPDGAEIQIDGSYVGNTPSTLQLPVGEHTILIKKLGYGPWERKLKLVEGDIRVSAELKGTTPKQ